MLELAQELCNRAEQNDEFPIPVLFNLSTWEVNQQLMKNWLVAELKSKYGIREDVAEEWVDEAKLLPMLDGLDEVESVRQESCVLAINQIIQSEYRPQYLVASSRSEEYYNYTTQLLLNGAIHIRSLTLDQIWSYLTRTGYLDLELWEPIIKNRKILDLASIPLFLSIIVLVYEEMPSEMVRILNSNDNLTRNLLDAYVGQMLEREVRNSIQDDVAYAQNTHRWLIYLAKQLTAVHQTEFLIENIQPSWLISNKQKKRFRRLNWLIDGITLALELVLFRPVLGLTLWILRIKLEEIKDLGTAIWSWDKAGRGAILGIVAGLVSSYWNLLRVVESENIIQTIVEGVKNGVVGGLFFVSTYGLVWGILSVINDEIPRMGENNSRHFSGQRDTWVHPTFAVSINTHRLNKKG
jgi:hypothetical protein